MSKNIHQTHIEQSAKNTKELRLRILNELDELHAEEEYILLALKPCSRKMGNSEKEKEQVFQ